MKENEGQFTRDYVIALPIGAGIFVQFYGILISEIAATLISGSSATVPLYILLRKWLRLPEHPADSLPVRPDPESLAVGDS